MKSKLQNLIKEYLHDLQMRGGSPNTIKSYGIYMKKFLTFIEANNLDFAAFTPQQARQYRNQLVQQGLKPRTVNNAITTIKSFYNYLVEEDVIKSNPIITRRLCVKESRKLPRFLTAEELRIINDWLLNIPQDVALGFRTMLATGMRLSEVIEMKCSDLIRLETGGYIIRVRHGKGNKERYVPVMDADVARQLVALKKERPLEAPLLEVSSKQYAVWSKKCRTQTGIDFYPHRCRHTVATQLLQKG